MSKIFRRGLEGVSIQMSFVEGRSALESPSKSCRFSMLLSIPHTGRKSRARLRTSI